MSLGSTLFGQLTLIRDSLTRCKGVSWDKIHIVFFILGVYALFYLVLRN